MRSTAAAQSTCADGYAVTARYYDRFYASLAPQDTEFYRALARSAGGPVLELGCGTGRITLPLARDGAEVVALDCSPAMLAQLREKLAQEAEDVRRRITVLEGSMADFNLGRRVALVLVPFRSFQHLLTVAEQRSCLAAVARHLAPDGRFVFNAFNPNLEFIVSALHQPGVWHSDADWHDAAAGLRITRAYQLDYEPLAQLIGIRWRYEEYRAEALVGSWIEEMQLRWFYRFEVEHLLELCGLRVVAAYGDYERTPLAAGAKELIYVCARAVEQ